MIDTPFPPDDRSFGWERGTSDLQGVGGRDHRRRDRGRDLHRRPLAGTGRRAPTARRTACRSCATSPKKFAERAFRRPLTGDEQRSFIERQFAATPDAELAVKRVVLLVLKSPRFLFPEVAGGPEQFAIGVAAGARAVGFRCRTGNCSSAAAAGKLGTRAEVAKQAERMLGDPRAKAKMREFLLTWLKVDQPRDLTKDAKRFPGFDVALATDLRSSLELFLDDVLWSESSDFRQLLLSD